ncbi:MAG: glycosyltransferase family 4 protein, partial [Rhodothermales bacterium]|nr:glycosyltransferase family 4 protein [Rhodothermales bacterium]
IVFLEANACGKPVIGARTGGIPDAILHRQTGLLVDADNDSELADAIIEVLTDHNLANQLGTTGRERVEATFTWRHVSNNVLYALAH